MQGEFRGDFTRDTFDPSKNFLRVLMQQGRVQVDADWNEQVSILLHYLQSLAEDLIGPHGGPINRCGFKITFDPRKDVHDNQIQRFQIGTGHYYVNGILCQNIKIDEQGNELDSISYYEQKDYVQNEDQHKLPDLPFLVYLDVWEHHITYIEDEEIREVALGGADTASRSQIVWQVKVKKLKEGINDCSQIKWKTLLEEWQSQHRGLLKAKTKEDKLQTDACTIPANARYRGAENQLYRVEIHSVNLEKPTFKWSRENSSVVFPLDIDANTPGTGGTSVVVKLKHWWHDDRFGLAVGDWVEIVDDDSVLHRWAEPLWKVDTIDPYDFLITLKRERVSEHSIGQNSRKHPLLRRWDQKEKSGVNLIDGAVPIIEVESDSESWITLENNVQIQFQKPKSEEHSSYRTGDYWLIPVRTATGDVEWSKLEDKPIAIPPHGIKNHYAPLAVIGSNSSDPEDCRVSFNLSQTIPTNH